MASTKKKSMKITVNFLCVFYLGGRQYRLASFLPGSCVTAFFYLRFLAGKMQPKPKKLSFPGQNSSAAPRSTFAASEPNLITALEAKKSKKGEKSRRGKTIKCLKPATSSSIPLGSGKLSTKCFWIRGQQIGSVWQPASAASGSPGSVASGQVKPTAVETARARRGPSALAAGATRLSRAGGWSGARLEGAGGRGSLRQMAIPARYPRGTTSSPALAFGFAP